MDNLEPTSFALLLTGFAVLIAASAVLSQVSDWAGVPVVLLFLALGMLAGREGIGRLSFENYPFCFSLGTVALVLILFDGGFNTPLARLREGIKPAAMLATAGVVGTAGLVGLCARLLGFSWMESFLLGAIVSSTDAAAVFSVLRGSSLQLKKRVAIVLELESGLNDPVAVTLTIALTQSLLAHHALRPAILIQIPSALAVGGAFGIAVGYAGRSLLSRTRLPAGGLYPVLTLALALIAFGLPALLHASGFLAVYIAAIIIGNGRMPYRGGIARVHDSIAWLCQVSMFLLLGLLVTPSQLLSVAPMGLCVGLFLAFVARPLAVMICLLPFRYPMREVLYIGWTGLRGAIPIILATYPIMAQISGAQEVFNTVFFVVVVNTLVPGSSVRRTTSWMGLGSDEPTPPHALLEIISTRVLRGVEVLSFAISASAAVCGVAIGEMPLPDGSAVILLIRGEELIAPNGSIVLARDDHVYVVCRQEDESFVRLLFGQTEDQ
jgi:potassium/hydrogen antiporter